MSERRNWRDFVGIVHRLAPGHLAALCGENQALQRLAEMPRVAFRKWEPTKDAVTCLGCIGEDRDA